MVRASWPIRLAGTWSRYSNKAMPQLMRAAMNHGLEARDLRWPYQASVIKTLLRMSIPAVMRMVFMGYFE